MGGKCLIKTKNYEYEKNNILKWFITKYDKSIKQQSHKIKKYMYFNKKIDIAFEDIEAEIHIELLDLLNKIKQEKLSLI